MNSIECLKFDFRMENEAFARALYSRWDNFFARNVERIADAVLSKYDTPPETLEINTLQLDLGTLGEAGFDRQFPLRFRTQLEEALLQCIHRERQTSDPAQIKRIPAQAHDFETLSYFLLHGTLPWTASGKQRDIRRLFAGVLRRNGRQLLQFLRTYGHYTSLQERLVYQLDDAELEKGASLLSPGSGGFICSYVRLLRAGYSKTAQPAGIRESDHRHTVWLVVYAYLLNNRGSYFDRKNFVAQTITGLAAKYNSGYGQLLKLITSELKQFTLSLTIPSELFVILLNLQRELSEEEWKTNPAEAAGFYKTIRSVLKNNTAKKISTDSREALIAILSGVDSCRLFLQHMQEEEITGFLPVVIPAESRFVAETAKSLDEQQEKGALQGKAGGEFRLLKWQIIFPVLFESGGTGFNRKYFVESVLRKVSAHYNIEMALLLGYFLANPGSFGRLDKKLLRIFQELALSSPGLSGPVKTFRTLKSLNSLKSLALFPENDRYALINDRFPQESPFIAAYVRSLDMLRETNRLQGKAGGEFHDVKWRFVFTVLDEMEEHSFSRKYFVSGVLHGLSAHYNLSFLDLLLYFQPEEMKNRRLPFQLQQILAGLLHEENTRRGAVKQPDILSPEDRLLVRTCAESMNVYRDKGNLQGKVSGNFEEIKRKFIFEVLLEFQHVAFNKKQFVGHILRRIASHYNLSFIELLDYFYAAVDFPAAQELRKTIGEIRTEERKDTHTGGRKTGEDKAETGRETGKPAGTFIGNAGITLLSPYLPRLFSMLELTENNRFKDRDAQIRAMFLIQYVLSGQADREYPEYEMTLNKLLTGFETGIPIPRRIELTEQETETVNSMLQGILQHWEKLKNTSPAGFREGFLQRNGKSEEKEGFYLLTVEEKTCDILLDSCPWSFRTIKYGWMKKTMNVKWR